MPRIYSQNHHAMTTTEHRSPTMTHEMRLFHRSKLNAQRSGAEFRSAWLNAIRSSNKNHTMTPARYASIQRAGLTAHTKSARLKAVANMPDGFFERQGKINAELLAKQWLLVSPMNVIYRFKNLSEFVRQNESLFDPADVVWKTPYNCNANKGLGMLRPTSKRPSATWKGWRWLSLEERLNNWCGIDPEHSNSHD